MKTTALIMAGGRGERFWPRSRKKTPKQFLALTDSEKTMIQSTVERILPLVKPEDIFIATNRDYRELVRAQLPAIPEENILCEPQPRNTAPCIGWGAAAVRRKYGDAMMLVLPSDHLILQPTLFRSVLRNAMRTAEQTDALVTLGIAPTAPDTGYGYIQYDTTSVHHKGPVAKLQCRLHIVSDHQAGQVFLFHGILSDRQYLVCGRRIQCCSMLIEQQELWRIDSRHQQSHCLSLSSGQKPHRLLQPILQSHIKFPQYLTERLSLIIVYT